MDFPTLNRKPSFTFDETSEYKTLKSPTEDGYVITRAQWTKPKKSWHLTYKLLSNNDYGTLKDFFLNSAKGGALSFNWLNPQDSTTYEVRFKDDNLKASYVTIGYWDVEFELEQV